MAVVSVGTPTLTTSTSSPITGTWGAGQNRSAGNLLVAACSAGALTSVTDITPPAGWTLLGVRATQTVNQVAFFSATAAGGDAAPAFSSTLSGTSRMSVTLFEFTGANTASPLDTDATSGLTGTTNNPLTVTTAAAVAAAGEYAICIHGMVEASSIHNTWTQDAAFTNAAVDNPVTRIHAAVDVLAGPTSGATLSCGGSWATAPTQVSAQIVVIAAGASGPKDSPQIQPGPVWLDLFKPWVQRPRPQPPALQAVNGIGSFALAPLAFSATGGQTSPDIPQAQPGPTWFDLFKPFWGRPRPPAPPSGPASVNGIGSFTLAPLAFQASGGETSPSVPQVQPGPLWLRLFKPWIQRPVPPVAAVQPVTGVSGTASFTLAPLVFQAQAGQTAPDQPQAQPGPAWLRLFRPWVQRPVPPLPARDQVTASGSLTLAPLAFAGAAGQSSPDIPQIQPGTTWLDLFKPWIQKPRPVPPAVQGVNATGSFTLAPVAFVAQAAQTSPDIPAVQPGPFWQRLFRPYVPKPLPPVPAAPAVGASGAFALAPLAFTAQGAQTSPDQPQVQPGPTWFDLFKPWVQRPRPYQPSAPFTGVTCTGSFSLAPLAFSGQGAQTAPDTPQVYPGPAWLRLFKPWVQKPVPPVAAIPPAPPISSTGSFTLAPLVFAGQGGQTSPDITQIQPGPSWFRRFRPWVQRPFPPVPVVQGVSATGSFTLAPLAFTVAVGQTSPDQPAILPGPFWTRLFRPYVPKPLPPVPSRDQVTTSGSLTLAPLAFTAQAGQSAPDILQAQPGVFWLRLFKPWVQRPVPPVPAVQGVLAVGGLTLAPLAFAGSGAQTSPDIPQAQPGPYWLRVFRPWIRRPYPWIPVRPPSGVSCTGSLALAPLAFQGQSPTGAPHFRLGVPGFRWVTGDPATRWQVP